MNGAEISGYAILKLLGFGILYILYVVIIIKAIIYLCYKASAWNKSRLIRKGTQITGLITAKYIDGAVGAIRQVTRMTIETEINGRKVTLDRDVPADAYFHYSVGDSMEVIIFDDEELYFIPLISLKDAPQPKLN